MRLAIIIPALALGACNGGVGTPDETATGGPVETSSVDYATQLEAPVPDYETMLATAPAYEPERSRRDAKAPMPANAAEIGETWLERLRGPDYAYAWERDGQGEDAPIEAFGLRITESEFERWVAENGWTVPDHLTFRFTSALDVPRVADGLGDTIRIWPASEARTGIQLQAAQSGRIFLRDGCFYVEKLDGPPELAWFHAETGLAKDDEGYLVLVDRRTGETTARIGEKMTWAGPNRFQENDPRFAPLREACGDAPILGVGNPQSDVRFELARPTRRGG